MMDHFTNLYDMLDKALALEAGNHDVITTSDQILFEKGAIIVVDKGGTEIVTRKMMLETLAAQQMADKLTIPVAYLDRCSTELKAANLEYWAKTLKKGWRVRGHDKACRAILNKDYEPINTSEILESLIEFTGEIPHAISEAYLERDDFHLRLNFTETEVKGDNYAVGVYFGNGQVGNRAFRVLPFIQRGVCTNTTQWKDGGFVMSHIRASAAFLKGVIKEKIGQVFGASNELLNRLVEAEMRHIPDPASEIARICKAHGLSQTIYAEALMGAEKMHTGLGIMHGLSYAAHSAKNITEQIKLEELAGAYLVHPESVFARKMEEAEM